LLKPAMFAQVEFAVGAGQQVLTVPDSAVIDSGTRRIVLVQLAEGRFEPREVETGARAQNYVEIIKGVRAGEAVVVAANFLIDAESNLKAVVGGFGTHAGHGGAAPGAAAAGPVAAAASAAAPAPPSAVGHKAQGTVDAIDLKAGTVSINHGAVATLKWPAMTMEFKAANAGLLAGLKTGQPVSFEFVERQPGEYVVTSIAAAPGNSPAAAAAPSPAAPPPPRAAASSHSGH
jgi:Cu/Ag efflux protein CusF